MKAKILLSLTRTFNDSQTEALADAFDDQDERTTTRDQMRTIQWMIGIVVIINLTLLVALLTINPLK